MRIEEDTKAQEAIHSGDQGTEPVLIIYYPNAPGHPIGRNRPTHFTQLQPLISNRI